MMRYMLDTNICIYICHRKMPDVVATFEKLDRGDAGISVITHAEMLWGAEKSHAPQAARNVISEFIDHIPVLPIHEDVSPCYAELRTYLQRKGTPIGSNDLWIAAHALAENLILITNNEREFKRIPKLKIENWTKKS
jgi:tRNA(fMet)-specific endonuclease VapC